MSKQFSSTLHQLHQAAEFLQKGNLKKAERLYRGVLAAEPANFTARHMLGIIRAQQGRHAEALKLIGGALEVNPRSAEVLANYANVLKELGRLHEALASYDKALLIKPDFVMALNNRGFTLTDLKRPEEALASCDKALAIAPNYAGALNNRGNALKDLKRYEEALASYDKALAIAPDYAEALNNRGVTLRELRRCTEALSNFDKVLAIKLDHIGALNNRGNTLWELKRFEESLASYDKALAIKPDYADAWNNRGVDLRSLRRFAESLASHERALAIDPSHSHAFDGLADAVLHLCDWSRAAKIVDEIKARVVGHKSVISPFTLLGYCSDASLQLQCAKNNIADTFPALPRPLYEGTVHRNDKIKVAYLSADFHAHATAYLMAGLIEQHDRSRFEVLGISFGPDDGSEMRSRLVMGFDRFVDVRGRSDYEVANMLKTNKVDIAIDLKGHTQDCRLGILSHRPCPIQVNYLGYPGTLGAEFIDYVIADPIVAPFDQQPFFTEKIVHLPDCYQVNDSKRAIVDETPSRGDAGLPEEAFVFCCFNSCWKITAPLFDIWMRLLGAVPGSVLWLIEDDSGASTRLRAEAAARGVDPERLVFATFAPPSEHLARHRLANLFLDTLPYNAHTTASDALWSGLPLVTCLGESFSGRVAASLLTAIGLPELVTYNLEQYEELALKLANDSSLLQSYRHRLQQNRLTSPLFDTDRFRRNIESAFTTMWEIYQRGEFPRNFSVESSH